MSPCLADVTTALSYDPLVPCHGQLLFDLSIRPSPQLFAESLHEPMEPSRPLLFLVVMNLPAVPWACSRRPHAKSDSMSPSELG